MATENRTLLAAKVLYWPVGRIVDLLAVVIAQAVLRRVRRWTRFRDHGTVPTLRQPADGFGSIAVAALEGGITAGVRALINRAGAQAFERWTGVWPGGSPRSRSDTLPAGRAGADSPVD